MHIDLVCLVGMDAAGGRNTVVLSVLCSQNCGWISCLWKHYVKILKVLELWCYILTHLTNWSCFWTATTQSAAKSLILKVCCFSLQCFHCKVKSQNWSSYHSVVNKTNSSVSHTEPYSSINQFNKTTHWCVPKPKRLETVFHDVVLSLSVCTVSTVKAKEPHSHWFFFLNLNSDLYRVNYQHISHTVVPNITLFNIKFNTKLQQWVLMQWKLHKLEFLTKNQ